VLRVGLTGGIGSGKSEVSRRLAAYGAVVIDADSIAREVVEPGTPGLAAVVEEFGAGIVLDDGTLNRDKLAGIVFADPQRLARLNAIVHPLVGRRAEELTAAAPGDAIVVYDVPLLAENDLAGAYHVVVVVDAPEQTQIRRLLLRRSMTEKAARARIAAQASRERRRAVADYVIDNSGTMEQLGAQVHVLWTELRRREARLRQASP
jgi:dephospho-CoA kinase